MENKTGETKEKPKKYLHEGHRARLRERYISKGIASLDDYEILELLLFYSVKLKNTNDIAHKLIDRYKTLEGVFNAEAKDIASVDGVGETSAALIKLVHDVYTHMKISDIKTGVVFSDVQTTGKYIKNFFADYQHEVLIAFFLNKGNKLLGWEKIVEGTIDRIMVNPGEIIKAALRYKTYSIIIAHNHPGGSATPSGMDKDTTRMIENALSYVDISLKDHFIIASDNFLSFAELGLIE